MSLGWGTTFRELKVLSKMPTFFVNHATGVGDHFPGARGAVNMPTFLRIGNLSVDFPLWTARAGVCPTVRVSF